MTQLQYRFAKHSKRVMQPRLGTVVLTYRGNPYEAELPIRSTVVKVDFQKSESLMAA